MHGGNCKFSSGRGPLDQGGAKVFVAKLSSYPLQEENKFVESSLRMTLNLEPILNSEFERQAKLKMGGGEILWEGVTKEKKQPGLRVGTNAKALNAKEWET